MLKENGLKATAMTGPDAGFKTNNDYRNAKVLDVEKQNVMEAFKSFDVVVVAGFQGLSKSGHVTTLGRAVRILLQRCSEQLSERNIVIFSLMFQE